MSGGLDVLGLKEDDVTKMLAATTHLGAENVNFQMEQYAYKRNSRGLNIFNLNKTWEKLLLAARAIVAVEHPSEIFVISSRPYGQRAVLKFAAYTGATPIAGRFTPGAFTNQIQRGLVWFSGCPQLLMCSEVKEQPASLVLGWVITQVLSSVPETVTKC